MIQVDTHPYLGDIVDEELEHPEHSPHIVVEDELTAMAIVDTIRNYTEQIERVEYAANRRIEEVTAWKDKETLRLNQRVAHLRLKLEIWARSYLSEHTDRKSISLPGAKLKLRKCEPEYQLDDATILDWLQESELDEFIRTKEAVQPPPEVAWGDLKKAIRVEDGVAKLGDDVVPGLHVVAREDEFQLEVAT